MNRRVAVIAVVLGALACLPIGSARAATDLVVTSMEDAVDVAPGDGRCVTASGTCTLRAAVMEANALAGTDSIAIPAGRFALTIPQSDSERNRDVIPLLGDDRGGDLDLTQAVIIRGAGAGSTVVDAVGLGRAFHTVAPATISDLTITGGDMFAGSPWGISGGGAIWNSSQLTLERVVVTANRAPYGGGVFNDPASYGTVIDTTISGNVASEAGGIRCDSGCTIVGSTISDNRVDAPAWARGPIGTGGGVDVRGFSTVTIQRSRITGNSAIVGGGINVAPAYLDSLPPALTNLLGIQPTQVRLQDTFISGNTSVSGPGNCSAQLARFVNLGGNSDSDGSCGL